MSETPTNNISHFPEFNINTLGIRELPVDLSAPIYLVNQSLNAAYPKYPHIVKQLFPTQVGVLKDQDFYNLQILYGHSLLVHFSTKEQQQINQQTRAADFLTYHFLKGRIFIKKSVIENINQLSEKEKNYYLAYFLIHERLHSITRFKILLNQPDIINTLFERFKTYTIEGDDAVSKTEQEIKDKQLVLGAQGGIISLLAVVKNEYKQVMATGYTFNEELVEILSNPARDSLMSLARKAGLGKEFFQNCKDMSRNQEMITGDRNLLSTPKQMEQALSMVNIKRDNLLVPFTGSEIPGKLIQHILTHPQVKYPY